MAYGNTRGDLQRNASDVSTDAAAEGYLESRSDQGQAKEFAESVIGAMRDANFAIMLLVNGFIAKAKLCLL